MLGWVWGLRGGLLLVFRFFALLALSEGGACGGSMVLVGGGVSWVGMVGLVCSLVYILLAGGHL